MPGTMPASARSFDERRAVFRALTDRLIVKDCATDALAKTRCGHNQVAIGAPGLLGLRDSGFGETFVAGSIALVHGEKAFVTRNEGTSGFDKSLRIHLRSPHFQLRISGISWPCLSM